MSGYTQYLGDTNRENIMTVTASYLNDTIRPLVAMTKAVNDWRIDIEHPLVGSIAVTRIGRPIHNQPLVIPSTLPWISVTS